MNPAPRRPSRLPDRLFAAATRLAGAGVPAVAAALVGVLLYEAWPALEGAGRYRMFTGPAWVPKPPGGGDPAFGVLAFAWGTAVTSAIAMLLAVPLGVASAAFLSEVAPPRLRRAGAFLVELLAAIPSVVYGFWGIVFLAPVVQELFTLLGGPNTGGNGLLSAGLILAVMILPYVTAISFDACRAVPRSQREGALALGATRWQTTAGVVLPYARPGIVAAAVLALGRALGETMAVTMLVGNKAVIDLSPFAAGDSIAGKIANSLNEADEPLVRSALVALALVLLGITALFNVVARLLLGRLMRPPRVGPVAAPAKVDPGESGVMPPPPAAPPLRSAARANRAMTGVLAGAFALTVVPLFLILGTVAVRGAAALEPALFTEEARPELTDAQYDAHRAHRRGEGPPPLDALGRPARRGGLAHAMLGSAVIVALATLLALPPALAAAVFLAESRNSRLASATRFVAELLGGVPSVVIGIFAYSVLVAPSYPWLRGDGARPLGYSGIAGAAALALIMVPVVVRSAEEALRLVPDSLRQASYALGAGRMQTTFRVTLPAALPAIVTGVFLAVARVAGETAPLLLTAGQWEYLRLNPARETPSLPDAIYKYSRMSVRDRQDQAWAAALALLAVVMLLNVGVRLAAGRRSLDAARAD